MSLNSKGQYTKTYSALFGVERDGSGSEISERRLSYSENMYRDYDGDAGGTVESVPGFRRLARLGKRINGIFVQKCDTGDYLVIHSGDGVYRVSMKDRDTVAPIKIGSAADRRSNAFSYFGDLFLLDGEKMHVVDKYGEFKSIVKNDPAAYVPTTYVGGVRCEMRNLFTDKFTEEMPLPDPYEYAEESDGLIYSVSDEGLGRCTVTGFKGEMPETLYIPKYKDIAGVRYLVYAIADGAFSGSASLKRVRMSEGALSIGKSAFSGCTSLISVSLSQTVEIIGERAFAGCTSLAELHLGAGCKTIHRDAFSDTALVNVFFGGSGDDFMLIDGVGELSDTEVIPYAKDRSVRLAVPVFSDVLDIERVTLDGEEISFLKESRGEKNYVLLEWDDGDEITGRMLVIYGTLKPYRSYFRSESYGFYPEAEGWGEDGFAAVSSCSLAASFDGRIFYAGAKSLPGVVFYSERTRTGENHPLYVGVYDYFRDGGSETSSLLAVRDKLAHFKKRDTGEGGIFYHRPLETTDPFMPKVYPVSSVHSGIGAVGESVSFFDDPIFLSDGGVFALRMANIDYERCVECVSHNVNFDILNLDLKESSLAEWRGYLALLKDGNIYLADSRKKFRHPTGDLEYEWFIMKGIGTYRGDYRVYRYSSVASDGYSVYPDEDAIVTDTVYSEIKNGRLVYYVEKSFIKYEVYPTDEWQGGVFDPAVRLLSTGDLLFFGTEGGDVCIFNSDLRGRAPDRIRLSEDFSEEEYKESMGRYIHPDFYSFAGHAPRYALKTKLDNCSSPSLVKDTVKNSLTVRARGIAGARLHIEVGTDRRGYREVASFPAHSMDFGDLCFSDLSLDTGTYISVPFAERERGWCEKQIALYSEDFASPIAISAISYRYKIKGKIKKR